MKSSIIGSLIFCRQLSHLVTVFHIYIFSILWFRNHSFICRIACENLGITRNAHWPIAIGFITICTYVCNMIDCFLYTDWTRNGLVIANYQLVSIRLFYKHMHNRDNIPNILPCFFGCTHLAIIYTIEKYAEFIISIYYVHHLSHKNHRGFPLHSIYGIRYRRDF